MLNIGQVVQNTETGKFVVYAGFDNSDLPLGPPVYFAPERVEGGDYTHIEDDAGEIIGAEFVNHVGLTGLFFGLIDPDKLDDSDWALIREICDRPAQPLRSHSDKPRPLSVDCC